VEVIDMTEIKWNKYLWESKTAAIEQVNALEKELNVIFPDDYKNVAIKHQGMVPAPNTIDVGKGTTAITCLMHFDKNGNQKFQSYGMEWNYNNLVEDVGPLIIPFAAALGANVFAFDYKDKINIPKVVFINADLEGDEAIIPVADNFTEFLSMLYEPED